MKLDPIDAQTLEKIAQILKITVNSFWTVKDYEEKNQLYLIHHTDSAPEEWRRFRGVVVSLIENKIICQGIPAVESVTLDRIYPQKISLVSDLSRMVEIDFSNVGQKAYETGTEEDHSSCSLIRGEEGTTIRIFYHRGTVYFSTNQKLNARNSRWESTSTFKEIYDSLIGPMDEELFPEIQYLTDINADEDFVGDDYDKDPSVEGETQGDYSELISILEDEERKELMQSSSRVYTFSLIHNELQLCNKTSHQRLENPGRIEVLAIWNSETGIYEDLTEDLDILKYGVFLPEELSINLANLILETGDFWSLPPYAFRDPRLTTGEFVVMKIVSEDGKHMKLLSIQSQAYAYRKSIRCAVRNSENILHLFCFLVEDVVPELFSDIEKKEKFFEKYVNFDISNRQDVMTRLREGTLLELSPVAPSSLEEYKFLVFVNVMQCIPFYQRIANLDVYQRFTDHKNYLTTFFVEKFPKFKGNENLIPHCSVAIKRWSNNYILEQKRKKNFTEEVKKKNFKGEVPKSLPNKMVPKNVEELPATLLYKLSTEAKKAEVRFMKQKLVC